MLIIGIICVAVAAPVMTYGLSTWPVVPQGTQTIQETSMTNITRAYSFRFTITYDEQVSAKVGCTYDNNTVTVKILTASIYDAAMRGSPNWSPATPTGLSFIRSQPTFGDTTPSHTDVTSYTTSTTNSFAFIDFAGDSGRIAPGTYVLIVYGDNTGVGSTDVKFDLQITQGFGLIWGRLVNVVGWVLVIAFGIIALVLYIKKTSEGRA